MKENQLISEGRVNSISFQDSTPLAESFSNAIASALYTGAVEKPSRIVGGSLAFASRQLDDLLGRDESDTTKFLRNSLAAQVRQSLTMEEDAHNAGWFTGAVFDLTSTLAMFGVSGAAGTGLAGASVAAGYADYEEGLAQGLDSSTAAQKGLLTGVAAYAGAKLPMTLGLKLTPAMKAIASAGDKWAKAGVYGTLMAKDVAGTAGAGIAFGAAQRGFTHDILKANGYDQMAAQYKVLDFDAMMVDGILGSIFGGIAKFVEIRNTGMLDRYIDTALAKDNQLHVENSAPGIALDLHSMNAGRAAFIKAFSDRAQGKSVDVEAILKDTNFAVKDTSDWNNTVGGLFDKHYPDRDNLPNNSYKDSPLGTVTDAEFNQMVKNKGSESPTDIHPDMVIPFIDERGNEAHVNAAETLHMARQEVAQAKTDKKLYDAAAACLSRNGL